jgi:hypothetical protein
MQDEICKMCELLQEVSKRYRRKHRNKSKKHLKKQELEKLTYDLKA